MTDKPITYVKLVTPDGKCARHKTPLEEFGRVDREDGGVVMDCRKCYEEHPNYYIDRDFFEMVERTERGQ